MADFFDDLLKERDKIAAIEKGYENEDAQLKADKDAVSWIPFIASLTSDKNHMIRNSANPDKTAQEFGKHSFMVTKALSMDASTILYCNEMNTRYALSPLMTYDYYFGTLRKSKMFAKWPKKDKEKDAIIKAIKLVFDYSTKEAERALPLIPKDQQLEILGLVERIES